MKPRLTIALALLTAVLQISFLTWTIGGNARALAEGTEITLKVRPVDPRDMLRGDYVQLAYDASDVPGSIVAGWETGTSPTGQTVYVTLKPQSEGYWMPVSAQLGDQTPPATSGQVIVRGTVTQASTDAEGKQHLTVDYGINRYYLPEGEGKAIEKAIADRSFGIVAVVDDQNNAHIKRLMDGQTPLFEDPLS